MYETYNDLEDQPENITSSHCSELFASSETEQHDETLRMGMPGFWTHGCLTIRSANQDLLDFFSCAADIGTCAG